MFGKPSLITRIAVGKTIGLLFGLAAFFLVPLFAPDASFNYLVGLAFWMILIGGFVGLIGVMTYHPVLHMPLPWWFRGPLVGGFMMLTLWLVAGPQTDAIAVAFYGADSIFGTGVWIVIDGLLLGFVMSALATWLGGEGKQTVDH